MKVSIEAMLAAFREEVGTLTQRVLLAETQAKLLQVRVNELEEQVEGAAAGGNEH